MSGEFRWLWGAAVQSLAGDQLARVAVVVLVFRDTHSDFATAAAYAATFLPGLAGAALGQLADRWPRRTLMVSADVLRAGLLAIMSIAAVPTWLVCVLLAVTVAIGGPFNAASTATVADLFSGAEYRAALSVRQAGGQLAQLAGFGVGGVVIAAVGPRAGLLIDAATYLVSAVLLRVGLHHRPAATHNLADRAPGRGLASLLADPAQKRRLLLICLVGFWIVPESLAAPYAAATGHGAGAVGLLLAALPAGYVVSSLFLARRLSAEASSRWVGRLAAVTGAPLIACAPTPPLPVAVILLVLCGVGSGYMVLVLAEYMGAAPADRRGAAAGLSSAAGLLAQGVGALAGGVIAQQWTPGAAIAAAGAAGSLCAAIVAVRRSHAAHTPATG